MLAGKEAKTYLDKLPIFKYCFSLFRFTHYETSRGKEIPTGFLSSQMETASTVTGLVFLTTIIIIIKCKLLTLSDVKIVHT